jgi:uncharacterized protein (DUF2147 family)
LEKPKKVISIKAMKKPLISLFAVLALFGNHYACAQNLDTITGNWTTFDDGTKQPAALVRIFEKNGQFSGVITKLLDRNAPVSCDKCQDFRKGKPLVGMEILSGLKKTGDLYTGGYILDPDEGEIYKVEIRPKDGGNTLDVRGYIGIPLLGRTQIWIRER